jgi:hypothetical protein
MSKPIYPIQALHKHDMIQNTTIRDHTHCSSTSILPYLSQYNYKKSNKNQWLQPSHQTITNQHCSSGESILANFDDISKI